MPRILTLILCVLLFPSLLAAQVPDARDVAAAKLKADAPLTVIDARFGAWWPGTDDESRWVVFRARIANPSGAEIKVPVTAWQLTADGEDYSVQPLLEDSDELTIVLGGEVYDVEDFTVGELVIAAGKSAETWVTFSGLPPGTHVPDMLLTCKLGGDRRLSRDVTRQYADQLNLKVERIGPGNGLMLLRLGGELDTINVGTLADTIDDLLSKGAARFVVSPEGGTDFEVLDWLYQVARTSGLSEMYHDRFPDLPTESIALHLVNPQVEEPPQGAAARWWSRNVHASQEDAVVIALAPVCRQVSREAIVSEIRSGHPLSRVGTLWHGAEKLAADDLPLVVRLTSDESPDLAQAAVYALRHFGEPDAIDVLTRLSEDEDEDLAKVAVESLAGSRYVAAHEALAALLDDSDGDKRDRIVRGMARHPRPAWSAPLYQIASKGDGEARAAVLSALTAVGHPNLHALLRQSLADDDATLSAAALEQLMKHTDPESERLAMQWTLRQLRDTPPSRGVLRFLTRLRDTRCVPLLMQHVGDESSKQRVALIQAILRIGDERAAEELAERFESLKNSERIMVLAALRAVGSAKFRELAESVMQGDSTKVVDATAELLAEDGSPWAVNLLAEALPQATKKKRFLALCTALAQTGGPDARQILRKAAAPDAEKFRGVARRALRILYDNSPASDFVLQGQSAWHDDENPALAMLYFELAVEVDSELPMARLERGNAIMRVPNATAERLQVAREDFAWLAEIQPESSIGLTGVALVDIREGHTERGVENGEKLREQFSDDAVYLYNMACVYGRAIESLENKDDAPGNLDELIVEYQQKALSDLRQSIELGLDDYNLEWMTRDPDLETIRRHPGFEQLFEDDE